MSWFIYSTANTFYILGCYLGRVHNYRNYQVETMCFKVYYFQGSKSFTGSVLLSPHSSVKKEEGRH